MEPLTGTNLYSQSGPENNVTLSRAPELNPHHQMKFSIISSRVANFVNRVLSNKNTRCHSEIYLFTEYIHVDIYIRGGKTREQGPVRKLL